MFPFLALLTASALAPAEALLWLREHGFQGPRSPHEHLTSAGEISDHGRDYQIFVYRNAFRPYPQGVLHGVNKIVILRDGLVFLGEYRIPMPTECVTEKQRVICKTSTTGIIDFSGHGPPREVLFDGEVIPFEPANPTNS